MINKNNVKKIMFLAAVAAGGLSCGGSVGLADLATVALIDASEKCAEVATHCKEEVSKIWRMLFDTNEEHAQVDNIERIYDIEWGKLPSRLIIIRFPFVAPGSVQINNEPITMSMETGETSEDENPNERETNIERIYTTMWSELPSRVNGYINIEEIDKNTYNCSLIPFPCVPPLSLPTNNKPVIMPIRETEETICTNVPTETSTTGSTNLIETDSSSSSSASSKDPVPQAARSISAGSAEEIRLKTVEQSGQEDEREEATRFDGGKSQMREALKSLTGQGLIAAAELLEKTSNTE